MQALACAQLHLPSFKHQSLTQGTLHLIISVGLGGEELLGDSLPDGSGTGGQQGKEVMIYTSHFQSL